MQPPLFDVGLSRCELCSLHGGRLQHLVRGHMLSTCSSAYTLLTHPV
jgi:hypothetical protein